VFGIPDAEFGEALMAVVEPQPAVTLDIASIRAQLKVSLADYKVPKRIEIQSNLPREDSGKIFKRKLLFDEGLINEAEYTAKKEELLKLL
jgi:long-chain acyl-CoA synthetase